MHAPRTPYPVILRPRLDANIARMQGIANAAGARLRPHAKTHKSPLIAKMQIAAGAVGICCAKLGEAEVFADHGIADIRLPYPLNPVNADRVIALLDRTRLSFIVDDEDVARDWSSAMTRASRSVDILVKVDVGFHRCGMNPDEPGLADRIARIAGLPGLNFRGLLSHAGHAYHAHSRDELAAIATRELDILTTLAAALRSRGVLVEELSVGSTPTAAFAPRQRGITEMRPGNYVFFDRTQVGLGAATISDCAMFIIATVVSRPAPTRVILDCGAKTLTNDGARGFAGAPGHGWVFMASAEDTPSLDIVIERLSEEHATCVVPADSPLRPGDRVRVLPNHSCPVTNLMDVLWMADADGALTPLPVAARGRIW